MTSNSFEARTGTESDCRRRHKNCPHARKKAAPPVTKLTGGAAEKIVVKATLNQP